ncbi:MAG TPA: molybdenum cofactor biosynthesis protein MoaE [Rhizomicrobium sp.]|nr:molybdenum cofactor biosynthesis protein MoaE [Rhizomicrobium sp.]
MIAIRVQEEDFDLAAEAAKLREGATGAIATFTGVVRGDASLSLEHYPGMTEREIARHVEDARARWPIQGVTVIHRIGHLPPGANIVLVAVASAHREAAFRACEFLIDYLKTRAPFWKQQGGDWVEARESDEAALDKWR